MAVRKPIFIVPLDLGTAATGNEAAGHPVTNLARHDAIGLTWKTTGATNVWARGQFAASRSIDFMSMVAAGALPGTQIRLRLGTTQVEVDGTAPYDSGALTFISPAISREDGSYHSHLELPAAQAATWWRIDITGHTGDFEAAMLVMGKKVEPSRFYNWDFEFGIEDLGEGRFTPWGVFDEQPGLVFRTLDFTLAWQTAAEFEGSFRPMIEKLGTRGMVLCVFDPEPTTSRQAKTYMGVLKKPGYARGVKKPGTYTQDFSIISMI